MGHAYQHYGVDSEKGCAFVLRPDQYVSFVTEVDDYGGHRPLLFGLYGRLEASE